MPDDPTLYIQPDELKSSLQILDEFEDADDDLQLACEVASRGVEYLTGRLRFYLLGGSNDEVRLYTPDSPILCRIDDLSALTQIDLDQDGDGTYETPLLASDYLLEPLNAAADGKPWERVVLRGRCSVPLPVEAASVRVTGRFGWATVPVEARQLAHRIASLVFQDMRDGTAAPAPGTELVARVGSDDEVKRLVGRLDRRPLVA